MEITFGMWVWTKFLAILHQIMSSSNHMTCCKSMHIHTLYLLCMYIHCFVYYKLPIYVHILKTTYSHIYPILNSY